MERKTQQIPLLDPWGFWSSRNPQVILNASTFPTPNHLASESELGGRGALSTLLQARGPGGTEAFHDRMLLLELGEGRKKVRKGGERKERE